MPELFDGEPVPVDETDREAARRALAQNWPELVPGNEKYTGLLEGLSIFHRVTGAESFELRYNLRPPKDRMEEWTKLFMQGQLPEEEYRGKLKADAERPIDFEMLTTFCDAYQEQLAHYSGILQESVIRPRDAGTAAWQEQEKAIDGHAAALKGKLPLWRENLETVFNFLEELRVTSGGGLVKVGEFEGTSAHWLAQLAFTRIVEIWRSCKDVSERSHRDPRYMYAAGAIDLFQQARPSFPLPQSIGERLREEFVLARAAIKRSSGLTLGAAASLVHQAAAVSEEQSVDNESRELMLVGEFTAIVAAAGHIYRPVLNSDWGIDGEVEFKDSAGRASGRRVYVQLKSGDSYLARRSSGEEIFRVKKVRQLEYWLQQAYPVMLVIRQSIGLIRWMDVSAYLKLHGQAELQIVFQGEQVTADSVRALARKMIESSDE